MIKFVILLCLLPLCRAKPDELPYVDIETTCFGSKHVKIPATMNDTFADLLSIAEGKIDEFTHKKVVIHYKPSTNNPNIGELEDYDLKWHSNNMDEFHYKLITKEEMYPENEKTIKYLLKDMATLPMVFITPLQYRKPPDFELKIWLEKYNVVIFKPERAKRDEQAHPDHFYYDDFPRHYSEIAAFHLDRVLGFRRGVPTVGRKINILDEIFELASDDLLDRYYVSPSGNQCLMGRCYLYCDTYHAVCGNPNIVEGSFSVSIEINNTDSTNSFVYPWKRSFDKRRQAKWEVDDNYCEKIRNIPIYKSGRRLLDIMDLAVMDFLVGNMARKEYSTFKVFENEGFIIHSEFGRGFIRAYYDEISILAPIKQCCMIRASTLKTLIKYHTGPKKLSEALRESMSSDPLAPILWEPYFDALDRRVPIILETVRNCLSKD